MAIQGPVTAGNNDVRYDFPEAYVRASAIRSESVSTFIEVMYYANKYARDNQGYQIKGGSYALATADLPPGPNPLTSAYTYLKSLPEFSGFTDV